jgi:hypothetical protein
MAMVGAFPPTASFRLIIRTMVAACLLSVIWAIFLPQDGIHQATDLIQNQHAGLWRGIFSHKQSLGVFAGLTVGLLLFYGSMAFPSPLLRLVAIGCSVGCLVGTASMTGVVTALITSGLLYSSYWITKRPPAARKSLMAFLITVTILLFVCFHFGLLDFIITLTGKSPNLTGRTDNWAWVLANIGNSGSALLGGGLEGGWEDVVAPAVIVDSGYIVLIIWLGYLGAGIVWAAYGWALWASAKLICSVSKESAEIEVFPFAIISVELFINITETVFLGKNINTILVAIAFYQIVRQRNGVRNSVTDVKGSIAVRPGAPNARIGHFRPN